VADTHLTNWEFEGHVRSKQIAETLSWVEERDKVAPAKVNLFGGDFNAKSNWGEMTQILKAAMNGGVSYQDHNGTEFTQGSHGDPSKRIDFIFVAAPKPLLQFVSEKILWKSGLFIGSDHFYPSDHLGVVHSYAVAAPAVDAPIAATSQEPTD
jgi:endonuclease/exonuclease/phosphatase family metal-dependent hydrolase